MDQRECKWFPQCGCILADQLRCGALGCTAFINSWERYCPCCENPCRTPNCDYRTWKEQPYCRECRCYKWLRGCREPRLISAKFCLVHDRACKALLVLGIRKFRAQGAYKDIDKNVFQLIARNIMGE